MKLVTARFQIALVTAQPASCSLIATHTKAAQYVRLPRAVMDSASGFLINAKRWNAKVIRFYYAPISAVNAFKMDLLVP